MQVKINVVKSSRTTDPATCPDAKQPMIKQLPNPSKLILSPLFADIAQAMPPLVTSPIKSCQSTTNGQIMTDLQSQSLLTPIAVLSQVSNEDAGSPADNYYFAMSGPKTTSTKKDHQQGIQQQPGSEVTSQASDTLKSSQMLTSLTTLAGRLDDDFSQLAERQVSHSSTNSLKQVKEQAAATVTMIGNGGRKVRGVVAASNKAMATVSSDYGYQGKKLNNAVMPTSTEQHQQTEQAIATGGCIPQQQQKLGSLQAFVSMANTVNQKVTNRKIVSQDIRNHTQPLFFEKEEAIALQPQQIGKKRAMRTNATAKLAHITSLMTPQVRENPLTLQVAASSSNDNDAVKVADTMNFYTDKAAISPLGFPVNEERLEIPRSSEGKNDGINDMTVGNKQRQKEVRGALLNQDLIFDADNATSSFFEPSRENPPVLINPIGTTSKQQSTTSFTKTRNVAHELALQLRVTATFDENQESHHPPANNKICVNTDDQEQQQQYTSCTQQQASAKQPNRAVLGQDYNLTNLLLTPTTTTTNYISAAATQQAQRLATLNEVMVSQPGAKTTKAVAFQTQAPLQQQPHFQRRYTKGLKKQALNHNYHPMTTQSSSDYKILSAAPVGGNGNKENTDAVSLPQFKRNLLGACAGAAIHQSSHSSLSSVGSMIINSTQQQQQQQKQAPVSHASPPLTTSLLTRQQLKGVCVAPKTTTTTAQQQAQEKRKLSQIHHTNNNTNNTTTHHHHRRQQQHQGSNSQQNSQQSNTSSTAPVVNSDHERPVSPTVQSVLQITGFSDNNSQKEDSESCSIADFIESTIHSQKQDCETQQQHSSSFNMNFRPITANHQKQKDKKLNVFQYLSVNKDQQQQQEGKKIDLPQSPPTRSRSVVIVEDLDSSTLGHPTTSDQHQDEMIKIQYPDTSTNCSLLAVAAAKISSLSDDEALSNSKKQANSQKLYLHTVAKRGGVKEEKEEEEEESKNAAGGIVASQLLLLDEGGGVVTERLEQTHQKDLLTTTSRNSITMRESLDFAYSESGMQISSQQKSHHGITARQEGTINQTPSSIDFILTTKEEQSAATPQSYGGPTINSTQKQRDALHSLASIQAYMQKQQVSDFNQKQSCCESQRRKKQLPVSKGDLSPSDKFLNQDVYDMTQRETTVLPDDKFSQYLDREIDRQELRLCTPKLKQKSRKKLNKTTMKLGGGNGATVTTSLVFDDEDIQLRDPVVAESKSPSKLKTSTTVKQASENAKEPVFNEEDDDAYCNIASLALMRRDTLSLYATASPQARRDRSISRNSSRSNISRVTSFSGNENSTPSDIMIDNPVGHQKASYSPKIDSPTQSYFKTQPEQNSSSLLLSSPKDRLSFKIKLLRMAGDNEDETKDVTTDQSSNSKSQAIATPPYTSHFKFNKSIDSSKSSSSKLTPLTENHQSGGNCSASASPLWKQKSTSPSKNTLPKIFVPRSSQEGIQGIKEQETMLITKDKFSRCSNFLKQKQPIAPFQGSPESKMVAISPSKQMLEAQSNKKMHPFTSNGKQTFINTKPMFLGPPAVATRRRLSNSYSQQQQQQQQSQQSNSGQNCQQKNDIMNGACCLSSANEYATTTAGQPQQRRHERLESLEMREAIYQSHGIMSSDEKQKTQSALFGGIGGGLRYHRKAHSFGYESASRAGEKLTLLKKSSDEVEAIEMLSPPLTVRNSTLLSKRDEEQEVVMSSSDLLLKHEKAAASSCQKLQSVQRLNQLKTTKKEKEQSKGHSLLTLKREEIVRVNTTRDLGNVSPKFVQITKVKLVNNQTTQRTKQLPSSHECIQ